MFVSALILLAGQGAALPGYGHDALVEGRQAEAIAEIIQAEGPETDDPARLINLGIAYAREGDRELARSLFEKVLASRERVELETAGGEWVDSRELASRALTMLENGEFSSEMRFANR